MTRAEMDLWLPFLQKRLPHKKLTAQSRYFLDGGEGGYIVVNGARGGRVYLDTGRDVRTFLWAIELFVANYEAE